MSGRCRQGLPSIHLAINCLMKVPVLVALAAPFLVALVLAWLISLPLASFFGRAKKHALGIWLATGQGRAALTLAVAGLIFLLLGQDRGCRALYGATLRDRATARLESMLPGEIGLIVRVRNTASPGTDPFQERPDTSSLRLRVVTRDGATLTSDISRAQLRDPPASASLQWYHYGKRFLDCQTVVDGATTEEGREVASDLSTLEGWREVDRLEPALVFRGGDAPASPELLEIYLCNSGASVDDPCLKVFKGTPSSEERFKDGALAVPYRDPLSAARRIATWTNSTFGSTLTSMKLGFVGAGPLLLAAGLGLFLRRKRWAGESGLAGVAEGESPQARGTWRQLLPPWCWLVVQAALLMALLGHLPYFELEPVGTEMGQREFILQEDLYLAHPLSSDLSWPSFVSGLSKERTFGFPLIIHGLRHFSSSLAAWPACEMAARILAAFVFFGGLRSVGVSGWLAMPVASTLLLAGFRWDVSFHQNIFLDLLAESLAVLTMGFLFLVVGRPQRPWAWLALGLSLFLTYQGRPAYLFLVGLVPLVGVLLTALFWEPARGLGRRLSFGLGLLAISVIPFLSWCTLRLILVGNFGLVSMGGYTAVHIPGLWLSEDVIPDLPEELQPLARATVQERDQQSDWQSPLEEDGWFSRNIVEEEEAFSTILQTKSGDLMRSKATELYGDDWVVVNRKLGEMARALIRARPSYYVKWLVLAARLGARRMVVGDPLLKDLLFLLTGLLAVWHTLYVVNRLAGRHMVAETRPAASSDYALALNGMVLAGVGFALASLLQVILVVPPEKRFMCPAGIFLPGIAAILICIVAAQVVRLLPRPAAR